MTGALIVAVASVPHCDVQIARVARSIAKTNPAAVVIRLWLIDRQDVRRAGRISHVRIRRHLIPRDVRYACTKCAAVGRVVDVKLAVRGIIRIEGQPQQPLLAAGCDARDLQKGRRTDRVIGQVQDLDVRRSPRSLLNDEEPARIARNCGGVQWPVQSVGHPNHRLANGRKT